MKREIITISDNGTVTVPVTVRMTIAEIADLFGIFYQTAKSNIRAIQKSGVADGDYSMCCTASRSKVSPEYYGLEMITALAFRINSPKAEAFRRWVTHKVLHPDKLALFLQYNILGIDHRESNLSKFTN